MYRPIPVCSRNATDTIVSFVRFSKISSYEQPYTVTGSIKQTGLEGTPKDICKDRVIGT
ncbi:hypothetical protein [Clostridium butyricum]|uniref:hypothetical protein n=1 Tax=Clostridium butyricum TaxID=1492 RepID=UPI002AAFF0E7|nr:hypothetical protein [Clostridium butyricum]